MSRFPTALCVAAVLLSGSFVSFASIAEQIGPGRSQPEYSATPDREDWDAAVEAAQTRVAAARSQAEIDPLSLAQALTALGDAYLGKGDYVSSKAAYSEALQLTRNHAGENSPLVLEPLRGLGYTFARSDQHDAAIPHLERSVAIARASYGMFDERQQDLLLQLARSLTAVGRIEDAKEKMFYRMRVAEKNYGEGDPRVAPAICDVGDWFSDRVQFLEARKVFQTARHIVEARLGDDDLALVEPLRKLAGTYMREISYPASLLRTKRAYLSPDVDATGRHRLIYPPLRPNNPRLLSGDGEGALLRALKILEADPRASKRTLIGTLIQTGDWFQIKQRPSQALPYYQRAWPLIAAEPATAAPTAQLNFPERVYYPTAMLVFMNEALAAEEVDVRHVQVEFTVTADGSVTDAHVVQHNTTRKFSNEVLNAVRAARYRPRFVDGMPVATLAMSYREVFRTSKVLRDGQEK